MLINKSFSISGMHCTSCSNIIERELKKVSGVTKASVNFAVEKAIVIFDPQTTSIEDLIKPIEQYFKAGFTQIYLHSTSPNELEFVQKFCNKVLPYFKDSK